jgi:alkanesulfonate monooxygenase SsuD/methylene tetrahydromethanopterin reductase-like flavin-dependent oxidoreductase (luciferase family)
MEFGLQLGWVEFDRLRDLAQTAVGLGFSFVSFPDHLLAEGPERQAMGVPRASNHGTSIGVKPDVCRCRRHQPLTA